MHEFSDGRSHILMCPPDYFQIDYAINPWMDADCPSDHAAAMAQWRALVDLLEQLGAVVHQMAPVDGSPDLVFTANAALVHDDKAVPSRFRHEERRGEERHFRNWFAQNGFDVIDLPDDFAFEGAGDALFCGDTLFAGYQMRSSAAAIQYIGEQLQVRVIPLELIRPRYYHLDTCFCPISQNAAIYYPAAFDEYALSALEEHVENLIPVSTEEAENFACNAVVVGKSIVTHLGCPDLHGELRERGFDTHSVDLSEFLKAGGSAKCLTLRLDGEEGAGWRKS